MHIAVLAAADSWYLADLRRAAKSRHEIAAVSFRDLVSVVECDKIGVHAAAASPHPSPLPKGEGTGQGSSRPHVDLTHVDAVLVRTMPPGSLEQIVFRMDALGQLEAAGKVVVNRPRAIEAAVDKYLATARLAAAGLLVPRTIVCQTPEEGLAAFATLGGDVVVKPLFGSEGRGIVRLQDEALADRAFRMLTQLGGVLYVQEFIPHDGFDLRVLVVGERMFAMRRRNPNDWRTNVSRGAVAEPAELTAEMAEMARRAADAIGASVAGVDLLPGRDGRLYAIEVNAVPGWKALAAALDVDIARHVLEHVERLVRAVA